MAKRYRVTLTAEERGELGRAGTAGAARVAAELESAAGEARARGGESSGHLARMLEDYAALLPGAAVPEADAIEPLQSSS